MFIDKLAAKAAVWWLSLPRRKRVSAAPRGACSPGGAPGVLCVREKGGRPDSDRRAAMERRSSGKRRIWQAKMDLTGRILGMFGMEIVGIPHGLMLLVSKSIRYALGIYLKLKDVFLQQGDWLENCLVIGCTYWYKANRQLKTMFESPSNQMKRFQHQFLTSILAKAAKVMTGRRIRVALYFADSA